MTLVDLSNRKGQCLKDLVNDIAAFEQHGEADCRWQDLQSPQRRNGTLGIADHADLAAIHLNRRDRRQLLAAVRLGRPCYFL